MMDAKLRQISNTRNFAAGPFGARSKPIMPAGYTNNQ
jgi:hypothetical protein